MTTEDDLATVAPTWQGRTYHGPRRTIDVVVGGAPSGTLSYHVVLVDGAVPDVVAGAAPDRPDATLEQVWTDAVAQATGTLAPVVAFMRGQTKTKGATRPVYELLRLLG